MPSTIGTFAKIIDVLEVGSVVKIKEVKPWSSTGYMWARISYAPEITDIEIKRETDSNGMR